MTGLTVSELTRAIRGVIEPQFREVLVRGEISGYRPAASGHAYFTLKDAEASISVAAFGWARRRGALPLRDGLQVLCGGRVTIFPPRGTYQLTAESIEPLGEGLLQLQFEELKRKLQAEGLFEPGRKRPIPPFPLRIAIVTSPTGAAIRDMIQVLSRRAPFLRLTIVPALVQGTEAPAQLVRALEAANLLGLGDLVVLTRGGGSAEDLACFNDERLARAIAASRLPVVSAVGHEIDTTISDFVADLRAPTPSAAAEILSARWVDWFSRQRELAARLRQATIRELGRRKEVLRHLSARLVSPRDRLREQTQRCDEALGRLERALKARVQRQSDRLSLLLAKLGALSPLRVLERGYAIVTGETGPGVYRSAREIGSGTRLRIRFQDGERGAVAT